MRGRKPVPKGNPLTASALDALPRCPAHLDAVARKEWRRLAMPLHRAGLLTLADRAALAAYCQAYARWAEAEQRLQQTPALLKTPNGHVQQSPWLSVANKQMELMGRFMAELGLTPSARARTALRETASPDPPARITRVIIAPARMDHDEAEQVGGMADLDRGPCAPAHLMIDSDEEDS